MVQSTVADSIIGVLGQIGGINGRRAQDGLTAAQAESAALANEKDKRILERDTEGKLAGRAFDQGFFKNNDAGGVDGDFVGMAEKDKGLFAEIMGSQLNKGWLTTKDPKTGKSMPLEFVGIQKVPPQMGAAPPAAAAAPLAALPLPPGSAPAPTPAAPEAPAADPAQDRYMVMVRRPDGQIVPATQNATTDPNDPLITMSGDEINNLGKNRIASMHAKGAFSNVAATDAMGLDLIATTDAYMRDKLLDMGSGPITDDDAAKRELFGAINAASGDDLKQIAKDYGVDPEKMAKEAQDEWTKNHKAAVGSVKIRTPDMQGYTVAKSRLEQLVAQGDKAIADYDVTAKARAETKQNEQPKNLNVGSMAFNPYTFDKPGAKTGPDEERQKLVAARDAAVAEYGKANAMGGIGSATPPKAKGQKWGEPTPPGGQKWGEPTPDRNPAAAAAKAKVDASERAIKDYDVLKKRAAEATPASAVVDPQRQKLVAARDEAAKKLTELKPPKEQFFVPKGVTPPSFEPTDENIRASLRGALEKPTPEQTAALAKYAREEGVTKASDIAKLPPLRAKSLAWVIANNSADPSATFDKLSKYIQTEDTGNSAIDAQVKIAQAQSGQANAVTAGRAVDAGIANSIRDYEVGMAGVAQKDREFAHTLYKDNQAVLNQIDDAFGKVAPLMKDIYKGTLVEGNKFNPQGPTPEALAAWKELDSTINLPPGSPLQYAGSKRYLEGFMTMAAAQAMKPGATAWWDWTKIFANTFLREDGMVDMSPLVEQAYVKRWKDGKPEEVGFSEGGSRSGKPTSATVGAAEFSRYMGTSGMQKFVDSIYFQKAANAVGSGATPEVIAAKAEELKKADGYTP